MVGRGTAAGAVVVGTVTCETTAWIDCFATFEDPFMLDSPFLTSGLVVVGGWTVSIGFSTLEETGTAGVVARMGAAGVAEAGAVCAVACAGEILANISCIDCCRKA